jgi:hypothetical protein
MDPKESKMANEWDRKIVRPNGDTLPISLHRMLGVSNHARRIRVI